MMCSRTATEIVFYSFCEQVDSERIHTLIYNSFIWLDGYHLRKTQTFFVFSRFEEWRTKWMSKRRFWGEGEGLEGEKTKSDALALSSRSKEKKTLRLAAISMEKNRRRRGNMRKNKYVRMKSWMLNQILLLMMMIRCQQVTHNEPHCATINVFLSEQRNIQRNNNNNKYQQHNNSNVTYYCRNHNRKRIK